MVKVSPATSSPSAASPSSSPSSFPSTSAISLISSWFSPTPPYSTSPSSTPSTASAISSKKALNRQFYNVVAKWFAFMRARSNVAALKAHRYSPAAAANASLSATNRGSVIIFVGLVTQIFILFTLFEQRQHSQQHQHLLQLQQQQQQQQSSNFFSSDFSSYFNNVTHVNFPIHFERFLIPSYSTNSVYHHQTDDPSKLTAPSSKKIPHLRCIQVAGERGLQSIEGIGAVFRLNQLAAFVASYYQVPFAMPSKMSEHGYDLASLFSDCGYAHSYMDIPSSCILDQQFLHIDECPSGDCHCLGNQIHHVVYNIVTNHGCRVLGVLSDRYKTQQFSGCLQPLLWRYFGTTPSSKTQTLPKTTQQQQQQLLKPRKQYDAIHYRYGDLAEKPGGKSFAPYQLEHLMRTLCDMSDRDIIVLTEGSPSVPKCNGATDRVIIANASGVSQAFAIMQHAQHVAVGLGGFSIILAEMARPTRMIMLDLHVRFFRWVNCNTWTVVTGSGARFHFRSRAHMLLYAMSGANLHRERFLNPGDIKLKRLQWSIPTRLFRSEMLDPVAEADKSSETWDKERRVEPW